ncbi:uncharacterized protein N7459_005283 [Penicillium hispanicum]|uniref:uncharacterized protein n=1 Tax=Penicillium hispanicum TaxID=1080232 RepID=UPI0025407551|nr:uncharacterized protein N7459_005283 [Penicillium hispanicum]KAJ5585483.1 hypothetical protein N7459_005283 [Penicillium hispanicum]
MDSTDPLNVARRRVFNSVFAPVTLEARPPLASSSDHDKTPIASFQSSISSSTIKTGSFASPVEQPTNDWQEPWDQAWPAITAFLAVPDRGFTPIFELRQTDESHAPEDWHTLSALNKETPDVLSCLSIMAQHSRFPEDLVEWYGDEIRRHFLTNLRNGLRQLLERSEKEGLLQRIVDCLQLARQIYLTPVDKYLLPFIFPPQQDHLFARLQRDFHAVVAYSLPWPQISTLLVHELSQEVLIILGIDTLIQDGNPEESSRDRMEVDREHSVSYKAWRKASPEAKTRMMGQGEDNSVTAARNRLLSLLKGLQLVGLGGDKAQEEFAVVMSMMFTKFIRAAYTDQWESPTSATQHLRHWIENVFARLAVRVLDIIDPPLPDQAPHDPEVNFVEKWQSIGLYRLGLLRTSELFNVIVDWPMSYGAIEDLREFTASVTGRCCVTHSFPMVLHQRLLHPGASTVEILRIYISIIRAFHVLDPPGVLLDRIARPIRRYLRGRDDTVKAIVRSLLAEPQPTTVAALPSNGDTLVELATELVKAHQLSLQNYHCELDWDDMNWMPDPVDAAPDYQKSKRFDVIDSLVSLLDSKETFVKELQILLGDRLLQKRDNFDQEISVLELLKVRFGDSALQACQVMLKDISDSRRVDSSVRHDQGLGKPPSRIASKRPQRPEMPELHAKILSRFFWPEIQDQQFKVPDRIAALQERYSAGFETLKQSRKLTWRNGLGQVSIELELGDRTFADEVTTWQATVIYAFQSDSEDSVTKTISDLADQLQMTSFLVRSACLFWVSMRILRKVRPDTFQVLEYLPADEEQQDAEGDSGPDGGEGNNGEASDAANAAAAAEAAAVAAAKESAEAAALEKMNLYWQFIVGMLTNQGNMSLQRIVMMLKLVVPGGFPFKNEELRDFLAGMVSRGKLQIVSGGNYKLVH